MIKAGDLVMLVRGHTCAISQVGGVPMTVGGVMPPDPRGFRCGTCGEPLAPEAWADFPNWRLPLSWLKKIDPLPELERQQRKEELPA